MEVSSLRMYAGIIFNREIDIEQDYISPGGFEFVMQGKTVEFDFVESYGGVRACDKRIAEFCMKDLDYAAFPDMKSITKDMLNNISEITDFFVFTGEPGESDLVPVGLDYVEIFYMDSNGVQSGVKLSKNILDTAFIGN